MRVASHGLLSTELCQTPEARARVRRVDVHVPGKVWMWQRRGNRRGRQRWGRSIHVVREENLLLRGIPYAATITIITAGTRLGTQATRCHHAL